MNSSLSGHHWPYFSPSSLPQANRIRVSRKVTEKVFISIKNSLEGRQQVPLSVIVILQRQQLQSMNCLLENFWYHKKLHFLAFSLWNIPLDKDDFFFTLCDMYFLEVNKEFSAYIPYKIKYAREKFVSFCVKKPLISYAYSMLPRTSYFTSYEANLIFG